MLTSGTSRFHAVRQAVHMARGYANFWAIVMPRFDGPEWCWVIEFPDDTPASVRGDALTAEAAYEALYTALVVLGYVDPTIVATVPLLEATNGGP